MNTIEHNNIKLNDNNQNNISTNFNNITNIITQKINNIELINDELIDELCKKIKLHCKNHNEIVTDWFDTNYVNDLELFKNNNINYSKQSQIFSSNSFISIKNCD